MTATLDAGRQARDAGMEAAESRIGAEQDKLVIDNAVAHVAASLDVFSINDVRPLLPVVSGPLIGSRFLAASRRGLIERVGDTQAEHEDGHARRVTTWKRADGSNPEAKPKQPGSNLLTRTAVTNAVTNAVTTEHEATIRSAHSALEARGRGKSGVHTTTDACRVIRSLLDVLADVTGITGSTDELF